MRKILLLMHVSFDGFVCGSGDDMSWIKLSEELFDDVKIVTDRADAALYGATAFKIMQAYWPKAGLEPRASKHDIEHSAWANNVQKYVFSQGELKTSWENTYVVHALDKGEIEKLKNASGKDILMLGSPTLAHSFMELNLIDEYYLFINPVILGSGKPLFKDIKNKTELELVSTKKYDMGVVAVHYCLK